MDPKMSMAPGGINRKSTLPTSQSRNASVAFGGGAANKRKEDDKPPRLPKCPEGQSTLPNQMPCERPRKGNFQRRRKTGFRVPLKKEDGNMEAQIIEYNCEFPNRVVVRLEYLMQSTKVRLNDKHYMDDFYTKLLEEERRALRKATRSREKHEQDRMKRLIIEGIDKEIPPEMEYLHSHPVFRVNQMLSRLSTYDTSFVTQVVNDGEEITPVEPYEFNGNKFFKVLHDSGDLWVPSSQAIYDENKLDGKIYRAKLRLLQKRKEDAADEKIMRILNNQNRPAEQDVDSGMVGGEEGDANEDDNGRERNDDEGSADKKSKKTKNEQMETRRPSWLEDFEKQKQKDEAEDEKLNQALHIESHSTPFSTVDMAVERIKAKTAKEVARLNERIRRSKLQDRENDRILEKKREQEEINYIDTFNYDKARIIEKYEKRQRRGQVDELFERQDMKSAKSENEKEKSKDKEKDRDGENDKNKRKDSEREKDKYKEKDEYREKGKNREKSKDRDKDKHKDKKGKDKDEDDDKEEEKNEKMKPYHEIFLEKGDEKGTANTKYAKEPLFKKLQKVYGLGNSYPFSNFEPYENELLEELDRKKNGKQMLEFGEELTDMYARELEVADDHVKSTKARIEERLRKSQENSRILQEKASRERTMRDNIDNKFSQRETLNRDNDEGDEDYDEDDDGGYEEDYNYGKYSQLDSMQSSGKPSKHVSQGAHGSQLERNESRVISGTLNKSMKSQNSKSQENSMRSNEEELYLEEDE